jgi:hypothetical protein
MSEDEDFPLLYEPHMMVGYGIHDREELKESIIGLGISCIKSK